MRVKNLAGERISVYFAPRTAEGIEANTGEKGRQPILCRDLAIEAMMTAFCLLTVATFPCTVIDIRLESSSARSVFRLRVCFGRPRGFPDLPFWN
jgi:hypothetical protein